MNEPWSRISFHGGFRPAFIHMWTFLRSTSFCCHSASCSGVHDCNHISSSWGVSLLVTEHSLCPGHPWGGSLFFTSCRSQYLHSVQGLLDRPSAFPCSLPGRCWISKSRTNRSSSHLAIWGSWSWAASAMTNDQSGSQSVRRRDSDGNVWQTPPRPRALGEWHSTSALYVSGHNCSRRWLSLRHLVPVRVPPQCHPN